MGQVTENVCPTESKDSGLHAASCGMSLRGLSAGQLLGFSTTPRTIQQLKATLSQQHTSFISQQFQRANEVCHTCVNQHNPKKKKL